MRSVSVVVLLATVLSAAGCGGGGRGGGGGATTQTSPLATKSPRSVLRDVSKAVGAASSFHMSGQINELSGDFVSSKKPVGIDFTIVRDKGATGSLTVNGAEVDLIVAGKNGYLRASSDFWKQLAKQKGGGQAAGFAAALFGDKWLKFPAGNQQFSQLTDPTKFGSLFDTLTNHGRLENKGDTTYQGQHVVAIESSRGGTLYVAATGTPYPVGLAKTGGKSTGAITFDNWNKPVTLTAPKGALDLSQFGG